MAAPERFVGCVKDTPFSPSGLQAGGLEVFLDGCPSLSDLSGVTTPSLARKVSKMLISLFCSPRALPLFCPWHLQLPTTGDRL